MTPDAVIVTGARAGIGRATAADFIASGSKVANVSRRSCGLDGAIDILADMSKPDWLLNAGPKLTEFISGQRTICIVHNAAVLHSEELCHVSLDDLRDSFELNVTAALALNQFLLPYMKPGSSIIYIGSTLSEKAVKGALPYIVSKHAVVGLMRATCQDLIGKSIHTACICPGFTDTEMLRLHIPDAEVRTELGSANAFGRLIEPEEIAVTIKFCAENAVINGAVIHANLGQIEH